MEEIIRIDKLKKFYNQGENRLEVLKGISLMVTEGEYLAVLGPSGSGKSTLMNIIGCMDRFQEGDYWLTGRHVNRLNDAQMTVLRNREIGFIFQKYHLIQKYTVLQNTMMPLLIRGMSHQEAAAVSLERLKLLGMAERAEHKPNELSGGSSERQSPAPSSVPRACCLPTSRPVRLTAPPAKRS